MLLRQAVLISTLTVTAAVNAQSVGINVLGNAANANAMLDVSNAGITGDAANPMRGMLIPRMSAAQRNAIPVAPVDDGLWVFQTDAPSGFYYYEDGAGWKRWGDGLSAWALAGNSVANPLTEWLGTSSTGAANKNFVVRSVAPPTATAEMVVAGATGFVSLGTTSGATPPTERLDVNGAIRVSAATGAVPEGTIQYGSIAGDDPNNWHYGHDGTRWRRMENAETLVTSTPTSGGSAPVYARDTMTCSGESGYLMTEPQLIGNTTGNSLPPTGGTPFITAVDGATNSYRAMRMQYHYSPAKLAARGLCAGPITSVGMYLIDPEPLAADPTQQTKISGTVRIHAVPSTFAFGPSVYMDEGARTSVYVAYFSEIILTGGWMDFQVPDNLGNYLNYTPGQGLIVDVLMIRNAFAGQSPKVDANLATGYNSCRWAYLRSGNIGGTNSVSFTNPGVHPYLHNLDDSPVSPTGALAVVTTGMAQTLATMRFNANITSPTVVARNANYIQYSGGLMVGTNTWANTAGNFKGPGTIRAQNGVYDGSVSLSDHVFDRYFDGAVRPEEREAAADYEMVPLSDLRDRLEKERHLPDLPSRQEWETEGNRSLGTLQTGLWRTVETQALYITQLEQDLSALEANAFGPDLSADQVNALIQDVQASKRLSDAQKVHLVAALRQRIASPASTK